jgi:PKD repeat protein
MSIVSKVISGILTILLVSVFCYPVFAVPVPTATPTPIGYTPTPTPTSQPYTTVYVSSSPEGAQVYVDGSDSGYEWTPYDFYLPYGVHTITFKLLGYEDWSTTIDVDSQDYYTVNAMLTPAPEQSLTFLPPFYSTIGPCSFDTSEYCLVEDVPNITMNYPYIIQDMVHNPNADSPNIDVTINETPVIAAHFEHIPPQDITIPMNAYRGSDTYFQAQYQHDWDWLWVSEDENSYISSTGQNAIDYLGVISGIQTKLYSLYYITQTGDIFSILNAVNLLVTVTEDIISLYQLIHADYQTSYLYTISSPDVSGTTSETVTIVVPQEKQDNLKIGTLLGITSGIVVTGGIGLLEGGVGIPFIAAGIYGMFQADNTMRAAADPDLNYTTPISVTPVDIPQLDQQPNSPLKEFALQCMHTATDTKAYADTYDKYQGAVISNDSVWEVNLQLECYNYSSQLTDDYQKEYALAVPAIQYLQEQGYNPTQSDVESSMNNLSQNGFSPTTVQMLQEAGFSNHEINSIKNITLQTPYSLVVNYNRSIPYLINLSQQQTQQLNDHFGSDLGILAPPSAQFTANVTSGNSPLTVAFTDVSIRNVTQWAWNFGDGATDTTENPVHIYTAPGSYTVNLTATNSTTGSDTRTMYDYITVYPPPPVANFTANVTSGQVPISVAFTDTSTNSPTSWNWSFGDGNTSTLENPSYQYTCMGTYTVTLNATNAGGSNITTQTGFITVLPPSPEANFTASTTSGTVPLTVQFTDTSTNSPTSWNWTFGDGSLVNATMQNPVHTYTTVGTYPVSLNATNAGGSNTITQTGFITVLPQPPVANFTAAPTSGIVPLTVQFTDKSTGSPTSWNWTFGDGSLVNATMQNPVHTYATAGTYAVSLNATNSGGSNTITQLGFITTVSDIPPVLSSIIVPTNPVAINTPVTASTMITHPNNGVTFTAVWTWGDGQNTSMNLPAGTTVVKGTHTYTISGMYTVSVQVTDSDGQSATAVAQSYVVIYNPKSGYVLGAGTFKSPAGAYMPKPTVAGTGAFGIAADYLNGKSTPEGVSDFFFNDTAFNFFSINYQWLAVNGSTAWFEGTGSVNGKSGYTFLVSTTEGKLVGKNVPNMFRIQIWNTATNTLVYDSQAGAPENAGPTIPLTSGTILIQK